MPEDRRPVTLTSHQLALAQAIAGEVTLGIRRNDLSVFMREHVAEARELFARIERAEAAPHVTDVDSGGRTGLALTRAELQLLCRMTDEALRHLGDDEFQTRTGFDLNEGLAFRDVCRQKLAVLFATASD
jgi:hypothetical protein